MAKNEILLIGDGSHPFRTMCWALEYRGLSIKGVRGPEAALEALVKKNYDLIIAKISRKEKNNLAVLRQAKKINPSTKVMLITDSLDLAFPLEAYNFDINDYIIMPIRALFNLLPVPPLDGSKLLLAAHIPMKIYVEIARVGFMLLIVAVSMSDLGRWLSEWSYTGAEAIFAVLR